MFNFVCSGLNLLVGLFSLMLILCWIKLKIYDVGWYAQCLLRSDEFEFGIDQ
jgi:hypothetical protein